MINEKNTALRCMQKDCNDPAEFVFTWPGRELSTACEGHAKKAQRVADAMGFQLALTRIEQVTFPF